MWDVNKKTAGYFNETSQDGILRSEEFVEKNGFSGLAWTANQKFPPSKDVRSII